MAERDLRVTSQTGSGKTVAIGLIMRGELREFGANGDLSKGPRALVVVPTRELAKQVHEELTWLYRPLGLRLACVTGGANYGDERRALNSRPAVVVGTPGRLLDHIERGALQMGQVHSIVLDEADRMLDLGFSEAIEAIFAAAPERKRTHLVSATLEPAVLKLANRYQAAPLHIQGTRYGEACTDIEHRVHLVDPRHRLDALVNLLLLSPDEKTLVFARTRADVGEIAESLGQAGFRAAALSGDMEQQARDRALSAFRNGRATILVATDVAARGIDVQDMTRVIQVDPPTDPESYTHRSGRTGRAGQKGLSIVFLAPARQRWFRALLAQARIDAKFLPLPSPDAVRKAADERLLEHLVNDVAVAEPSSRWVALAERLLAERDPASVVSSLIARTAHNQPEPRDVPVIFPESSERQKSSLNRKSKPFTARGRGFEEDAPQGFAARRGFGGANRGPAVDASPRNSAPRDFAVAGPNRGRATDSGFPERSFDEAPQFAPRSSGKPFERRAASAGDRGEGWGMFHVTWGQLQGADPRRMLAVVCRRGQIRGADVGAIRIGPTTTTVEIRGNVVAEFASNALKPDPQEPRIRILPVDDAGGASKDRNAHSMAPAPKPWETMGNKRQNHAAFPKKLKKLNRASA
jgi:ATP-dependent RNA helicase DeaD